MPDLLKAARRRADLLAAARVSHENSHGVSHPVSHEKSEVFRHFSSEGGGVFSHFLISHSLGDENVRKSPKNLGNLPGSAILMGGFVTEPDENFPRAFSHNSHGDEKVVRINEKRGSISAPCTRCGAMSGPMIEVVNPEGWICGDCWPGDPNDAAHDATERAAMMAEADPAGVVLHDLPTSWADPTIAPTAGARCRCCRGASWWCEAERPKGWRCGRCHPPHGAGPVQEVQT